MRSAPLLRDALVAALALALAGCPSPRGVDGSTDPLDARWLEGPRIHGDDVARLAALGKNDPEVTALFAEATRTFGGSFDSLASHMSICPQDVTQEGGLTLLEGYDALVGRPIEEVLAGAATPTADAALRTIKLPVRASRRFDEPDSVRFELTLMPKVCFVERLTIGEAYEAVIHELVHAVRYDPHDVAAIAVSSPDEVTFLRRVVLARGGEAEAYTIATRARLRIPGGHFLSPLGQVIDIHGTAPIAPEALADAILAPRPRGLGYASTLLLGKYQEGVVKARELLGEQRKVYEKLLGERRNYAAYLVKRNEVDQQNLVVFAHNVEVGKQRNDPRLVADSQRKYTETQASLARAKALADVASASAARLTVKIAEIDARLAAAGATNP